MGSNIWGVGNGRRREGRTVDEYIGQSGRQEEQERGKRSQT